MQIPSGSSIGHCLCFSHGRPTFIQGIVEIEELPPESAEAPAVTARQAWAALSEQLLVQALLALSLYTSPWASVYAAAAGVTSAPSKGFQNTLDTSSKHLAQCGKEQEGNASEKAASHPENGTAETGLQQLYKKAFTTSLELYTPWADLQATSMAQELLLSLASHVQWNESPSSDSSFSSPNMLPKGSKSSSSDRSNGRTSSSSAAGCVRSNGGAAPESQQEQLQQVIVAVLPLLQKQLQQVLRSKPPSRNKEEAEAAGAHGKDNGIAERRGSGMR